jgi:hypothetical protein
VFGRGIDVERVAMIGVWSEVGRIKEVREVVGKVEH